MKVCEVMVGLFDWVVWLFVWVVWLFVCWGGLFVWVKFCEVKFGRRSEGEVEVGLVGWLFGWLFARLFVCSVK